MTTAQDYAIYDCPVKPLSDNSFANLSLKAKPLQVRHLAHTVPRVTAADRIRERLKDEMQRQHLSQRHVLERVNHSLPPAERWTQSRLSKILNGHVHLWVDDLEALAAPLHVPLVELVRQRGAEYFAELTPSELQLLEALRDRGPEAVQSVLTLLRGAPGAPRREHDQRPGPPFPDTARPAVPLARHQRSQKR